MQPPSQRAAAGFDIVVWVDNDGDIVCRAFTSPGHKAIRKLVNDYRRGDIVQIYNSPEEFQAEMPESLAIGMLQKQSKKVVPLSIIRLH
jgi:hypothetical protein